MITNAVLLVLASFLLFVMRPILSQANVVLDPALVSAFQSASVGMRSMNYLFPISTLLIILGIFLSIELAIFGYKVIMWILKKIPGIN